MDWNEVRSEPIEEIGILFQLLKAKNTFKGSSRLLLQAGTWTSKGSM